MNSPSNPTGGVIPPEDLDAIAELAKANPQLWVFSDEIYAQLVYDGRKVAASYLKSAEKLGVCVALPVALVALVGPCCGAAPFAFRPPPFAHRAAR